MKHMTHLTKVNTMQAAMPAHAQDLLLKEIRIGLVGGTIGVLADLVGLIADILELRGDSE